MARWKLTRQGREVVAQLEDWHGFENVVDMGGSLGRYPGGPIVAKVRCCGELHEVWLSRGGQVQLRSHHGKRKKEAMFATDAIGYEVRCLEVLRQWKEAIEQPCDERQSLPKGFRMASIRVEYLKARRQSRKEPDLGFGPPDEDRLNWFAWDRWVREWERLGVATWALPKKSQWGVDYTSWFKSCYLKGFRGLSVDGLPAVVVDRARNPQFQWLPILAFLNQDDQRNSYTPEILYAKKEGRKWELSRDPWSNQSSLKGEEDDTEEENTENQTQE